jgi:hypothetical protein
MTHTVNGSFGCVDSRFDPGIDSEVSRGFTSVTGQDSCRQTTVRNESLLRRHPFARISVRQEPRGLVRWEDTPYQISTSLLSYELAHSPRMIRGAQVGQQGLS